MANRATLIKRAIIVLGSPIALGYLLMKATARDPQKDLAVSSSNKLLPINLLIFQRVHIINGVLISIKRNLQYWKIFSIFFWKLMTFNSQALTPEQRKQIEVNRKQNKELFEAMLSEDVKKKLSEKQEKAREKQESRRY